mgnify:FL=1
MLKQPCSLGIELGVEYFEVSAKTGENVKELIDAILQSVFG